MKLVLAQPAITRFQWELDVVLTNLTAVGCDYPIVLLFTRHDDGVVSHIRARYPHVEIHVYEDTRQDKEYAPTVRPFLWWKYLKEDPAREQETYFQIDSDIIFREMPDFSKIPFDEKTWYGSDCAGYINHDYLITRQNGDAIVHNFAAIIGVEREIIEKTEGVGAQWIMVKPTAEYWLKVYRDCNRLWHYLEHVSSDIQKWTAEMWAQLYNAPFFGIEQKISPELDFCRPTDDIKMWDLVKILHNAGVVGEDAQSLFYKTKYIDHTPFAEDLSWVRKDKAGLKYAEAIKAVVL